MRPMLICWEGRLSFKQNVGNYQDSNLATCEKWDEQVLNLQSSVVFEEEEVEWMRKERSRRQSDREKERII